MYLIREGLYTWSFLARKANDGLSRLNANGILQLHQYYITFESMLDTEERSKTYESKWGDTVTDPNVFGFSTSMRYICIFHCVTVLSIFCVFMLLNAILCIGKPRLVQKTKVVPIPLSEALALAEDVLGAIN